MKEVNFITNALLKNIIGKDLITDDNLAVLELVKNSFDAGSPSVTLEFNNLTSNDDAKSLLRPSKKTSSLVVYDLGVGMDESDISDKWLNIAYSEKKFESESFGRIQAGNKGVGRFSCDRLGNFLTIYTRKNNCDYFKLYIDWGLFETEGNKSLTVQDIKLTIESLTEDEFLSSTPYHPFLHGTILEICKLREFWSYDKILSLKRELERFINPNQSFSKSPFEIKIIAKEYLHNDSNNGTSVVNGIVENKIFSKLNFKTTSIEAQIDERGEYITTELQDRGINIFTLKENNPFSQLKNIKITVYYLNTYAKRYFSQQTGVRSVDFGSIFLFINGFRVPPYGDVGDDWLGLEIRKGQGHSRYLGTREIVGRIEICENEDKFKIISNRAGVVNNLPFIQLTKSESPYGLFYKTFRRLERFVVEGIHWDKQGDYKSSTGDYFKYDDLTRSKNVISVITNIAESSDSKVESLVVNEEFLENTISAQVENSKSKLVTMLHGLTDSASSLTIEEIDNMRRDLQVNTDELIYLRDILSKLTGRAHSNDSIENLSSELVQKQQYLLGLQNSLKREQETRAAIEAENVRLAQELAIEKEKNTYLRSSARTVSEDAKGLIHNIKLVSTKIGSSINNLYDAINKGEASTSYLLKELGNIRFQSEKVLKISKLITRANFKADASFQYVDVVGYINQYLSIYKDIYEDSNLQFDVICDDVHFYKKISVLELALVFDDLISNAEKNKASLIRIVITQPVENGLVVQVSDNGKGINEKFISNPDMIFELGVTTTNGSGIGLHSVRTSLKKMGASINVEGSGIVLSGLTFKIVFK